MQEGVIIAITDKKTGKTKDDKVWTSQDLVIEFQDGNYTKKGVFNAYNKDFMNTIKEGDSVKVYFNIDGSEWNGRWFPKLSTYKVEAVGNNQAKPTKQKQQDFKSAVTTEVITETNDDLPF